MIFPSREGKPLFFRNRLFLRFYSIITAGWLWEYGKKKRGKERSGRPSFPGSCEKFGICPLSLPSPARGEGKPAGMKNRFPPLSEPEVLLSRRP
jgi:hypothetical protein